MPAHTELTAAAPARHRGRTRDIVRMQAFRVTQDGQIASLILIASDSRRPQEVPPYEMSNQLQPEWFVLLFIAAWMGMGGLLAHLSGWRSLATRFPSDVSAVGEKFRFASGSLGTSEWFPVRYANCLFVTVTSSGLAMSIFLPFRFLCPRLFIPWSQVASVEEQQRFLRNRTVLRFKGSSVQLTLFGAVGCCALAKYRAWSGHHAH